MKKLIVMLVVLVIAGRANSQIETRVANVLKGKVVNTATNEPVAYANVGIEDTFYGTASDENGNFQLKIPEEMVSRQIFFSSVGFQSRKLPVSTLFEKEFNIIKLEPQTYDIEKVDIAGRSMVLARVLRMASENTPYNFISGPVNFTGSFRNEKLTNDTVQEIQEAEVLIFDKSGYRSPSKTNAFNMRTYEWKQMEPPYSFASGILNFDELLHLDWVRNASSVLNPALTERFELALSAEPEIDGKPAWVISFSQKDPTPAVSQDFHATAFKGEITIFKDDYSVKEINVSAKSKMHNRQGKFLAVGSSNSNHYNDVAYNFTVTYSKMKPEMISIDKTYNYKGDRIKESSELQIKSVEVENVKEVANRDYFAE